MSFKSTASEKVDLHILIHLFPGFAESKVLAVGMPIASIAINSTTAKVNRIASK